MKKRILLLALMESIILFSSYGQISKRDLSIKFSANLAFLGLGDYLGFYYYNGLELPVSKAIKLSGTFGTLISANDGEKDIFITHNNSYISGDIILILTPLESNKIYLNFYLGTSVRKRSEFEFLSMTTVNGISNPKYSIDESFDYGYLGLLGFGIKLSSRSSLVLDMGIHSYNKGTSISSIGLGINLKI
jgi:hypothetical protein